MSDLVCCSTCEYFHSSLDKEPCNKCSKNNRVNWKKNPGSSMYSLDGPVSSGYLCKMHKRGG